MSWQTSYGTRSHEDLRTHGIAFMEQLSDDRERAQLLVAVEQAIALSDAMRTQVYCATLSGHAGPSGETIAVSVSVAPERKAVTS